MPRSQRKNSKNQGKGSEIEIKLRVGDLAGMRQALRRLKARPKTRMYEHNIVFDTSARMLFRQDRLLRMRIECPASSAKARRIPHREATDCLLTLKGPGNKGGSYKVRSEKELRAEKPAVLAEILRCLGYRPWFRYEKFRTEYRTGGAGSLKIDLDETPVGVYLELEGPRREIRRIARQLGFGRSDYVTGSYWELYRDFCRQRGKKVGNMLFGGNKNPF